MKKLLLTVIGLAGLGGAPALAADLPARVYTKAPPPVVAPIYNWGGFYIGVNGGGGSARKCWGLDGVAGINFPGISEGCHDATGGMAGGQIGYRWQATNWVFGVEAQGDWADFKGSNTSLVVPAALAAVGLSYGNNTKIDAIGLFTGQVGYAWNNVLWYVKGGAAVTHDKYFGVTSPALGLITFDNASEDRWGGTVGTGVEIGFAPGWSVAFEYDHLFMGSRNVTTTLAVPLVAGIGFRNERISEDVDIGTVRVNYTFGGPVVAKYCSRRDANLSLWTSRPASRRPFCLMRNCCCPLLPALRKTVDGFDSRLEFAARSSYVLSFTGGGAPGIFRRGAAGA